MFSDEERMRALSAAAGYGKWLQAVRVSEGFVLPGLWQPQFMKDALLSGLQAASWRGKKVLDIGACNGGLTIELARLGAEVHAIEPNPVARQQFEFSIELIQRNESLNITFEDGTLFSADRRREYDIVLFLGLVYHFRYPQLVLDYLAGFNAKTFFVSSQTYKSDSLVMLNRKEATPQFYGNTALAGYHPSRPLLRAMMEWAGFKNVQECVTELTGRDFEDRVHKITNSAYFFAEKGESYDYELLKDRYM